MSQIGSLFPNFRGEDKKYLSCHHLGKFRNSGGIPTKKKITMTHGILEHQKGTSL